MKKILKTIKDFSNSLIRGDFYKPIGVTCFPNEQIFSSLPNIPSSFYLITILTKSWWGLGKETIFLTSWTSGFEEFVGPNGKYISKRLRRKLLSYYDVQMSKEFLRTRINQPLVQPVADEDLYVKETIKGRNVIFRKGNMVCH